MSASLGSGMGEKYALLAWEGGFHLILAENRVELAELAVGRALVGTRDETIAALRRFEAGIREIRRALALHQPGDIVTWFQDQHGGATCYEVVADGYGKFALVKYEGQNPNDRMQLEAVEYSNLDDACRAARRLGEYGVDWSERDFTLDDERDW